MYMTKVMIVDDNPLIRQSLRYTIEWEELQCRVIGDAGDGMEALECAKINPPDLLITDIKMPGMDGLELTKKMKELHPGVVVIIITGYEDFSYAQQAIKLGAFDLILKPIESEEIRKTVENGVKEIVRLQEERNILKDRNKLQHLLDDNRSNLIKGFFLSIIQGILTEEGEIKEKAEALKLNFKQYAVVKIKPILDASSGEDGLNEFNDAAEKVLYQVKLPSEIRAFSLWYNNCFVIFFAFDELSYESRVNIRMNRLCNEIVYLFDEDFHFKYIIGVSGVHGEISELTDAYMEAQSAVEYYFFSDSISVIYSSSLRTKSILNEYVILKKIAELPDYIGTGNQDIEALLDGILIDIRENESKNADYVRSILIDMCITSRRILFDKNIVAFDTFFKNGNPYNEIYLCENISTAFAYTKKFILSVFDAVNSREKKNLNASIKIIIDYLNKNFNKKVTLQELSDVVLLSPAHLSRLIKKETGQSFVDLLNSIKIGVAVKLLSETNMKAYEVAEKVGFENYAYFYQVFKKVTGVSPKDYSK